MYIALHDADNTSFPNLALMKLSNYHRARNDFNHYYKEQITKNKDNYYDLFKPN